MTSGCGAASWARSPARDLERVPALDLRAQPQTGPTRSEVKHGAWHIGVASLVVADGVAVGEAEDPCDVVGVDELVERDSVRHEVKPTAGRRTPG